METAYTREEFLALYDDYFIKRFFKNIDEMTRGNADFFEMYGITKNMLKSQDRYPNRYSIPFEVAPLLVAMIHSFEYAHGRDRRGHPKGTTLPLTYERYDTYISEMLHQIDQLEPYQQALIKNYRSFDYVRVIDKFIPHLIERIAVFITILFSYSGELIDEAMIGAVRGFDSMIEGLAKLQLDRGDVTLRRPQYTFENAITGAFFVLAGCKKNLPNSEQVSSIDLEKMIIAEIAKVEEDTKDKKDGNTDDKKQKKPKAQDVNTQRKTITDHLNKKYEEYLLTHQDTSRLHDENIGFEVLLTEKRWEASSQMELYMISEMSQYRQEVERCIQMRNGLGEFKGFEKRFNQGWLKPLDDDAYEELNSDDRLLYDCYAPKMNEYITNEPDGSKGYRQFVEEKVREYMEFMGKAAEIQSKLQKDPYRMRIIEIYQQEKKSEQFEVLQEILGQMFTRILTNELGSKKKERQK